MFLLGLLASTYVFDSRCYSGGDALGICLNSRGRGGGGGYLVEGHPTPLRMFIHIAYSGSRWTRHNHHLVMMPVVAELS